MTDYPAEPWDLHGHAYVGMWLVPRRQAPEPHHSGTRQIRLGGRVLVLAAFFRYDEPSPLIYDEIMATQPVLRGWRPRVSITHIWVDSPASRDGGRALWAIPKDLAEFRRTTHANYAANEIADLTVRRVRMFPLRLPLRFRTAQDRDGRLVEALVRGRVGIGVASGSWRFAAGGPLAFLSGRRPLLTLAVRPFHLAFGQQQRR